MATVTRDIGMGCKRGIVVQLISVAIGLPLGLCGVGTTLWLVTTFDFSPGVLVVVALLWLTPLLIGVAFLFGTAKHRASKLDALFVPLGLEGTAYMSFFRQYHGTVYGRQTDVYLWRGPFLQIEIETPLRTRFGITEHQTDTTFFADLAGKTPLALADPELAALSVFPLDETWTRALLADSSATGALRRLTQLGSTVFTRQQVILRPGTLFLLLSGNRRMFGIDITAEQAKLWVDDLIRVVQAAEALPAPQITEELSSAEQFAQRLRSRNPYSALWVGLGIFGFFVVIAIIIFVAVFALT